MKEELQSVPEEFRGPNWHIFMGVPEDEMQRMRDAQREARELNQRCACGCRRLYRREIEVAPWLCWEFQACPSHIDTMKHPAAPDPACRVARGMPEVELGRAAV